MPHQFKPAKIAKETCSCGVQFDLMIEPGMCPGCNGDGLGDGPDGSCGACNGAGYDWSEQWLCDDCIREYDEPVHEM